MGARGPSPTPTNILKARDSWLAKKRDDGIERQVSRPHRPKDIGKKARYVWDRLIKYLEPLNILNKVDRFALRRYAEMFVIYQETQKSLDEKGYIMPVKDRNGQILSYKDRPEIRRLLQLNDQLCKIERSFAMSPGARAALSVAHFEAHNSKGNKKSKEDSLDYFKIG